jgi:uncharacterized protein (DUF2132 family)
MNNNPNDLLHGLTLEAIINKLVEFYGWEDLGKKVNINCFNFDASVKSSLKFLRKTYWARLKVEKLYIKTFLTVAEPEIEAESTMETEPKNEVEVVSEPENSNTTT